jgi:hypothetical protein
MGRLCYKHLTYIDGQSLKDFLSATRGEARPCIDPCTSYRRVKRQMSQDNVQRQKLKTISLSVIPWRFSRHSTYRLPRITLSRQLDDPSP